VNLSLEGLAFLTDCALAVSEQSAWKYAHTAHRAQPRDSKRVKDVSEYERAVRCNYSPEEKTALLRVSGGLD
jgi:cytoplasmic FMR1 interacting protein